MSYTLQTRLPDQLIVCDDCSTDNTVKILESFAASAPFSVNIYMNKAKLGTGANFGQTLTLCDGDIIAFSDQDDVWLSNKLERIEQTFIDQPHIGYVISDAIVVDDTLTPFDYTLWNYRKFTKYWQNQFEKGNELDVFLRLTITTGMVTAIRARLRHFGPPIPNSINHDAWYIPLAAIYNYHGALIKEPLVKYRQHAKQQYGAARMTFKKRTRRVFKNNTFAIMHDIQLLESLIEYIERNRSDVQLVDSAFFKLKDKLIHLYARKEINNRIVWSRIPNIYYEMKLRRYFKYGSWKNIIVDFLS